MLVQVKNAAQARRAELDGYDRIDKKALEAPLKALDDFLDRDDISVQKVVLARDNGEDEAAIIDREIRKHSGTVEYRYPFVRGYKQDFKVQSRTLFEVSEKKLTIRRRFREVVDGDYDLIDPDGKFESLKQEALAEIDEKLAEWEDRRERVASMTVEDLFGDDDA